MHPIEIRESLSISLSIKVESDNNEILLIFLLFLKISSNIDFIFAELEFWPIITMSSISFSYVPEFFKICFINKTIFLKNSSQLFS